MNDLSRNQGFAQAKGTAELNRFPQTTTKLNQKPPVFIVFLSAMGRYLLEDYELDNPPQSLANLLDYFSATELDINDIFILLLYILTLETGFVPKELLDSSTDKSIDFTHNRVLRMTERFPEKWKGDRTYFIDFVLPKCPSHVCQLFCLVSDDDVLATFRLKEDLIGYSHLFDPKAFIVGPRHFQNLRGLSVQFKDKVCFPVKTTILSMHDVQHSSLAFLPFELLVAIMGLLRESDIVNVGRTCRRFAGVLEDSKVQQVIRKRRKSFDRKLQRVRST